MARLGDGEAGEAGGAGGAGGDGRQNFYSLFPIPYSLFPIPCSLTNDINVACLALP
ncbi:MAG: hypothetical protein RID53_00280 [Coleofasciculus sp. B1-GNL1-01]|uniref:hypothetical protein n=1 Tax=Coleofasciculus sp. B1-GNL1-01 TaxID=3068484 RepID=UPI0032F5DA78